MSEAQGFLSSSSEEQDFERQGRRIPRSVRELADGSDDASPSPFGELLEDLVANGIRLALKASGSSWRCLCIEVTEDDGMTWSAEAARRAAGKAAPHFRQICLIQGKRPDRLPQIVSWIGQYRFLRLAVAHKLTSEFVTLRSWMTPLLVAAVVALTGVVELLKRLSTEHAKAVPGFMELFLQPSFWAETAALFVCSFGLKYLKSRLDTRSESKSCERFVKQLGEIPGMQPYPRFRQALAEEMARSLFPRVVVIDNFEGLEGQDEITKDVVREYFQNARKLAAGSEFWIVFEKEDGDRIGTWLQNNARPEDRLYVRRYKQLFLTASEKKSLVNVLQLPPGAEEYTTVGSVCRYGEKGAEAVERFLKEYRQAHPPQKQQYDALHILYLLALTASPGQATFEERELVKTLSQTGNLRSEVLREFLSTSEIFQNELKDAFEEIRHFPGDVVICDSTDHHPACRATREAQDFLTKNYGNRNFRLSDPGTGHLYWALLYYDQLFGRRSQEAFWVRKLIYHLVKASTKSVHSRSSYTKLKQQLFDAHLFGASAGLSCCLGFKDILALLERAADLIATDDPKLSNQQKNRVLKACWNAYSVLGDEKILQVIFDLYSPGPVAVGTEGAAQEGALALFFTDLVPLKDEQRSILNDDFFGWIQREYAGDNGLVDDCCARAAWFIFILAPMLEHWKDSSLLHTVRRADLVVEDLTRRAIARLDTHKNTPLRLADAITLSLGLWCCALRFHPVARERTLFAWFSQSTGSSEPPTIPELLSLLALCQQAIHVAKTMSEYHEPQSSFAGNMLFGAMARELCVVSLAAAQVGCALHLRSLGKEPEVSFYSELESIARRCGEILDFEVPTRISRNDLLGNEMTERTGALLRACELVWQDFGLSRLQDFLNLRRVHFAALAQDLPPAHFDESTPLVKSLIPLLASSSYGGVLANCLVAACLQKTPELGAFYLSRAARTAMDAGLSDSLKKELCLLAISSGNMYDHDLVPHLNWLLREPPSPSQLEEFLTDLDEMSLLSFVFAPINVGSRAPELGPRVLGMLRKLSVSKKLSRPAQEWLQAVIDVRELQMKLREGMSVNPDDVLKTWDNRKHLDLYSTVLESLTQGGYASAHIDDEGLAVLRSHFLKDSYSGFLKLAWRLGDRFHHTKRAKQDTDIVTSFLRISIIRWEGQVSALTTVDVYKLLSRLDPSRYAEYVTHIVNAECVILRCNYIKHLPDLAREGRFFSLFLDYWRSMSYWGLECDWGSDLPPQLNLASDKREELARQWLERGAVIPRPFTRGKVVAGQFLLIGNALISPPVDRDPRFESARQAFNQAAEGALPALLKSVALLKDLPESIRLLILAHEKRLEEVTSIFATGAPPGQTNVARGASFSAD